MKNPPLENLEETIQKLHRKTRPPSESEKKEIFGYLNQQLANQGLDGRVVSILTHSLSHGQREINCYEESIKDGVIFNKLNLSVGTVISYPSLSHLTSYREGYFVPGKAFRLKEKDQEPKKYVALINIKVDPDSGAVYFKPSQKFKAVKFP